MKPNAGLSIQNVSTCTERGEERRVETETPQQLTGHRTWGTAANNKNPVLHKAEGGDWHLRWFLHLHKCTVACACIHIHHRHNMMHTYIHTYIHTYMRKTCRQIDRLSLQETHPCSNVLVQIEYIHYRNRRTCIWQWHHSHGDVLVPSIAPVPEVKGE